MSILDRIDKILETTNLFDFCIQKYDGCNLSVIGSFDFCYYHELEIIFQEVSYISLPVNFSFPKFRMANNRESGFIFQAVDLQKEDFVFCIEAETSSTIKKTPFFIVAESILLKEDKVYYFYKKDLKENERIAEWVK